MATLLIVDDDDSDLALLRAILEGVGHRIFTASNGGEALKLYQRQAVDVVVTDMQMPRGDGLELITALKGIDPGASIVAVSGQAPARLQVAHQSGARSILTKPIDRHELIEAVERALRPPENDPLTI